MTYRPYSFSATADLLVTPATVQQTQTTTTTTLERDRRLHLSINGNKGPVGKAIADDGLKLLHLAEVCALHKKVAGKKRLQKYARNEVN